MDTFTAAGGLINCALFLAILALAGIADGNRIVVVLALLSVGVAVMDYSVRAIGAINVAIWLWGLSNLLAVAGLLVLIAGYFA